MGRELQEKMKKYLETFYEGFPTYPLAWGRSDDEVIEIIDNCLRKKKDVYELGYVKDDDEVFY